MKLNEAIIKLQKLLDDEFPQCNIGIRADRRQFTTLVCRYFVNNEAIFDIKEIENEQFKSILRIRIINMLENTKKFIEKEIKKVKDKHK